jgi:HD-GYP domain-containing protein (c-di-GMP phosphodiesterase class II)
MTLALPIHHPRSTEAVLLQAGVPLDALSIPHLRDLGVEEVWIRYPGLEHLCRIVDGQLDKKYKVLTSKLALAMDQALVRAPVAIDFYDCKRALTSIIRRLGEHPQSAIFLSDVTGSDRCFLRHCGNVAVLSMLMGMRLDFYLVRERPRLSPHRARDLTTLGIGALFHDIGMLRLPPDALARWHQTHDETNPAWRMHATLGFEMVRSVLAPAASCIVLHHHQSWDGSGFPERASIKGGTMAVAGHEIHIYPRIVAAAEMLHRLIHPVHAPGGDALAHATRRVPLVRALKQLVTTPLRTKLDPVVFRALLSVTPPYAPGSVVTLSNGAFAVVVDWSPADPCRPIVEMLDACPLDQGPKARRKKTKPRRVDLRACPELCVAEIDDEDVRDDNFAPTTPGEFDLAALLRSMTSEKYDELAQPGQIAKTTGANLHDALASPHAWDIEAA